MAQGKQAAAGFEMAQQLTENYGARKLVSRCYEIIGMAKTCHSIRELRQKVAEHYGKEPVQLTLYLPKGEGRKLEDVDGLLRAAEASAWKDDETAN